MRKYLLFLFSALALVAGAAALSVKERGPNRAAQPSARVIERISADDAPDIYGWLRYDETSRDYGLCKFNAYNPETIEVLYPYEHTMQACAGAYADGKYYVYMYNPNEGQGAIPLSFGTVDLVTGKYTEIADYKGLNTLFADMTYDYSTQTMYAIGAPNNGDVSQLMTVSLTDGKITQLGGLTHKFVTLACSYDGQLYAVKGDDGYLYSIDKATLDVTEIGYTYEEPEGAYLQSMDFDHNTNTLYWACNNIYEEGVLATINLETGESTRTGTLGGNAQVVGLYIPFEKVDNDAPAAVSDLKVTPSADGALKATLSWTNPTKTYAGADGVKLTQVEVYRDGVKVHTLDGAEPGKQMAWEDNTVEKGGLTLYRVVAVNEHGSGESVEATVFVGFDVPAAPTEVVAEKLSESSIKVSWKAPEKGITGDLIDLSTLSYRVVRFPDNKEVATGLKETTFTDATITVLNNYSYEIEASTATGVGGKTRSESLVVGPALEVPYSCNFSTDEEFALWTVVDANGDSFTWRRETTLDAAYYYYNENDETVGGDDWLISSPIRMEAGKTYRLRFKLQSYDSSYEEKMAVYMGQGNTKEAMTTQVGDYSIADNNFQDYEVVLPPVQADGNYNLGFHCHSDPYMFILYLTGVTVEEATEGALKGTVTDGKSPVEGATVTVVEEKLTVQTDAAGAYSFPSLKPGEYTLTVEAEGFAKYEQKVTVKADEATVADIELGKLVKLNVSGKVLGEAGNPLSGARVAIKGYEPYATVSGEDGTFAFSGINAYGETKVIISRYEMEDYEAALDLSKADINLGDVQLTDKLLPPFDVTVEAGDAAATVVWKRPMDLDEYRNDSGVHDGRLGRTDDTEKSVYGAVFRTPARLTEMTWYTELYLQEHPTVNIFVFDLDESGQPTSKILYSQENVPNKDNTWSTFRFPQPVDAPRGYMLAVSGKGHTGIGLALAEGTDYPFVEGVNCFSTDYTTGEFVYTEEHDVRRPMMIRAKGVELSDVDLPEASVKTYKVWRLAEADMENEGAWTLLTAEPQSGLSLTDKTWADAPQGIYRFAVCTVYADGEVSEPEFSAPAANKMEAKVTVNLTTNTPKNEAAGATVTLTNNDDESRVYTATADADGRVVLEAVWKGTYTLTAEKHGYVRLEEKTVNLSTEKEYALAYELKEYVVAPFGLEVREESVAGDYTFTWNTVNALFDDFEGHEDFAVNSPGKIGWSYIDGDGEQVYPIDGISYPNAEAAMAYMIFNPYQTEPAVGVMDANIRPLSGEKFLAAFPTMLNNDFIISPELDFTKDFTFKFYAKSYTEDYGKEKINVGYSVTGKEPGDFTWLNGDAPLELPMGDWTTVEYTVPKEARYVTINCVSDNLFVLMIDDVFIGFELPDGVDADAIRSDLTFEVYLDGEKLATTADKTYRFTGLAKGMHKAGVKALFASETTPLVEVEFDVTEGAGIAATGLDGITVYPNPTSGRVNVRGGYDHVFVMNATGSLVGRYEAGETVDISDCPAGVYFLKVVSGDRSVVKTVILAK